LLIFGFNAYFGFNGLLSSLPFTLALSHFATPGLTGFIFQNTQVFGMTMKRLCVIALTFILTSRSPYKTCLSTSYALDSVTSYE